MKRPRHNGLLSGLAVSLLLALATATQGALDGSKVSTEPAETKAFFRIGEKLDYRVGWQNFLTAATAIPTAGQF